MYLDPALTDEPARLAALQRLAVLDSEPEEPFDNVVALVRAVLGVPMAAVSLIDEDRQWFKAACGLEASETPRDVSFCTHTIAADDLLVIADTREDPRFATNPMVVETPFVRFYAGVPLRVTPPGGGAAPLQRWRRTRLQGECRAYREHEARPAALPRRLCRLSLPWGTVA